MDDRRVQCMQNKAAALIENGVGFLEHKTRRASRTRNESGYVAHRPAFRVENEAGSVHAKTT
ncbi:hypothetical protein DVH24_027248 [Malus domestica]|uniref:Uncharacterized protein n=1 Tax=Malus domestica TaxID=3750 RepID=A0A498IMG7_MALDO|nr:hypothetical protein DVH24_027248 [Malus domestica]